MIELNNNKKLKPLIKWVGGKTQSLEYILPRIPKDYNRYFDPFMGGGAIPITLQPKNLIANDKNPELVNFYNVIKYNLLEFLEYIDFMDFKYTKEEFLSIRNMDRSSQYLEVSNMNKAVRFLYLNKTSFNGLYRVNNKGYYNTSFGNYSKVKLFDLDNITKVSEYLKTFAIYNVDYSEVLSWVDKNDFVYLDPPYYNTFTNYNSGGFCEPHHQYLFDYCKRLNDVGAKFLMSNSDYPFIRGLYSEFNIEEIPSRRSINCDGSKRGSITELLISNY